VEAFSECKHFQFFSNFFLGEAIEVLVDLDPSLSLKVL